MLKLNNELLKNEDAINEIVEEYNELQFWKHQAEICRFRLTSKEYQRFDELEKFLIDNIQVINNL